jgi:predicted RNA binding protein YcfA (HicA-like mRNA interferase family)
VRESVRLVTDEGWEQVSQRGNHRQFKHATKAGKVTVAGELSDDVPIGTLKSILRQADLEKKDEQACDQGGRHRAGTPAVNR